MKHEKWANEIYLIAYESIKHCLTNYEIGMWKEDFITAEILKRLNELPTASIQRESGYKNVSWEAFKFSGKPEYTFGDIAIIVKVEFSNGASLEGVAYIEAKRIYHSKKYEQCSFSSIDWEKLEEYSSPSHAHYVVLYDVDEKSDLEFICNTIPTKHLLEIRNNKRDIYPFCEYFHQLMCFRLLMGYGLDFDPQAVINAKGFGTSNSIPKYVLTATVKHSPKPELALEPIIVNNNLYESIISPKKDISNDLDPGSSSPSP
ncbi:hypothetical protein [Vibrio harveyi]